MHKNNIVENKVQLTQLEIKQYFEILNKYISGNGIDAELTYAALKTIKSLEKDYQDIAAGMYNPDTDPKFAETLKLVSGANEFNRNYLNQSREVTIYTWQHIEQVPDEIPGVFMLYMFKSEF